MPLAPFDAHWLAEAIRLREQRDGRLDDARLLDSLRASARDFDTRALARAEALADSLGWREALAAWHGNARLATLLLAALACSSGAALAWTVVGDGSRPVNLVWALLGLLGMHGLSLVVWGAGMLRGGGASGAALGRLWLRLVRRIPGADKVPELPRALAVLLAKNGLARWLFGLLSHGLWALLLASALLTLVALFSLRRYGFVWETTILSTDTLGATIAALDGLPALIGLGAPATAGLDGAQPAADRAAWAQWLMACLAVYGLAPRVALWAWCRHRWRQSGQRLRIDLEEPDNLLLRRHLMPEHGAARIADPAPAAVASAHLNAPRIEATAGAALVGIELAPELDWPPPVGCPLSVLARVDSRAEREAVARQLEAAPPRRLLVAFDARISPDRGSIALFARLAAHAQATAAWLVTAEDPSAERPALWREALTDSGLPPSRILNEREAALLWLEAADG
ncbi:MAG: DUF2868 domain-containing protein [Rhodocyclaceae bacterium]|nr:DUF2868 domain-containing protein [Rhodocyclaceae bacterium]